PRDGRPLPLSFAQQRLWFLHQLEPGSTAYHLPTVVRLRGTLDVAALQQALTALVARHESLRTVFAHADEQPVQVIMPPRDVPLPVVDVPAAADDAMVHALVQQAIEQPFDLAQGPLLRVRLVRLAPTDQILILALHHIVTDGWSMDVLLRELTTLYLGFATGEAHPEGIRLPPLPIQYADYALWQRQVLSGYPMGEEPQAVLEAQRDYWRTHLVNLSPLYLPTDRPRAAVGSPQGARVALQLPAALLVALHRLSQRLGATPFMTLLAAWNTLLYRYSGQADIAVGTPVAGRTHPELEDLIGFFVNTLVVRTDLTGAPSFAELVARVRATCLDAYAHQDLPFEVVVDALQPERDLSRQPLFQVMFALQNTPRSTITLPDLTLDPVARERLTAKFDLSCELTETVNGLVGSLEYRTDLFDAARIERMAAHFAVLLHAVVADPDQRIDRLPLLTETELQQLDQWNATEVEYAEDACIHQLFEAQTQRAPDATAIVCGDRSLTYRELDQQADLLARYLRMLGVGVETRVGVCVERSIDQVISLLAILKAGAVYVPIDPAYPQERIRFILADAQVAVLLTYQRLAALLHSADTCPMARVICLDAAWPELVQVAQESSPTIAAQQPTAENLAYIIYTSGSTGTPKGVMLHHRGLCNLIPHSIQMFGIGRTDRVAQVISYSFDGSVWECLITLLAGASLYIGSQEELLPGPHLQRWLHEHAITVTVLVPSMLGALDPQGVPALHTIICGGEAISRVLMADWAAGRRFFNTYGPTEATVNVTVWASDPAYQHMPPIGRPNANTQIHLLDRSWLPVPIGVPGELYVGGVQVARGYLNRPDLTAERFIPDPFSASPGSRLYKTGDLACYLPDGNIEFLGRIDQQVKIRGYRVELGEIEAMLRQYEAVQDAIAVARTDPEPRLVAYVVPKQNKAAGCHARRARGMAPGTENGDSALDCSVFPVLCSPQELRAFLGSRLPAYMVPDAFVLLDAFPLTPSGKVDRRALPAPACGAERDAALVGPRTPTEELLANIWGAVLGVEQIGMQDNFFALGGHSLLATQVVSRLREILKVEVPLRLLFEAPTIASFAAHLAGQPAADALPLLPVPRDGRALPLSFAQQRLWFLHYLDPASSAYHIPLAVRLHGVLDPAALHKSLTALVQRHEVLRTTVAVVDAQPVQVIAATVEVPLPVVDLPGLPEAMVSALVQSEIHQLFDLQVGPLLRARLVRLHPEGTRPDHLLILILHHIVSDGWSQSVLLRELTMLYRGFAQGDVLDLPPLPIQYADYALWQRQWLQDKLLEAQLSYWRQQLANVPPLDLPSDYPRPAVITSRGAQVALRLPAALTAGLRHLSQRLGATLFMTLLAAFKVLLYRDSHQADLAVGTPIAGRVRPEL
ncbi:MAG TPA: amino acid adenylation domain-containing protein, partial [Herpetosiphonaceae bacterium]